MTFIFVFHKEEDYLPGKTKRFGDDDDKLGFFFFA